MLPIDIYFEKGNCFDSHYKTNDFVFRITQDRTNSQSVEADEWIPPPPEEDAPLPERNRKNLTFLHNFFIK